MAMENFPSFFTGKTVTLLGLGILGRGVGDAAFLARHCRRVLVTDLKGADDLRPSLEALHEHRNIEFTLGRHDFGLFENVDFVVKGAGVRLDNPYIAHARENGVPVYMSTALFAKLAQLRTIGVTGTRGKTTTTCMAAEILKRAGRKVMLGGNIRGVSTLAQLPDAAQFDYAVLELDSWQLQGFDDLNISPNIGVFTTFYPDHMNYYDGDMARYLRDKTAIFRHQKAGDTLVASEAVSAITREIRAEHKSTWITAQPLPPSFPLRMPGEHNRLNAGLARAAVLACGVDAAICDAALRDFAGVEGRLQRVGEWQGRVIYNDNNATTQDATLAALKSFPPHSIVLIFGGADKGLPIDDLLNFIAAHGIRAVLINGSGSDRVLAQLQNIHVVDSMPAAVAAAQKMSRPGDNIVLSPAFASFGVFKNEYDRNDQFMAEVKNMVCQN